jgi:hypothetical protein
LESTARDVLNELTKTLGQFKTKLALPPPLDEAVAKLWGFSSQRARHVVEGSTVGDAEAELCRLDQRMACGPMLALGK